MVYQEDIKKGRGGRGGGNTHTKYPQFFGTVPESNKK
jgi:hypothetical protein